MNRLAPIAAFCVALLLAGLCLGAGAPSGSIPSTPENGDWMIDLLNAEPATLNPITATDASASAINDYIYESLIRRNPRTLKLEPVLAESWEISEDHLAYTFRLKRNVRWQDGHPFTAKDILYSFDRIMDPRVDAAHLRNYYQDIEKIALLDDYTVRYHYRKPYFRALEFCGGIPIVPAHVFQEGEDFNNHPIGRMPVGTGPYRMLKWETGKEVTLVRNENYWGNRPHFDRILYRIITNPTAALQVLKQGGLDVMPLTPIQWVKQTQNRRFQEDYRKIKYNTPSYRYIGWNNERPVFSDRRVRQAMTLLIDREMILNKVLFGLGTVVSGTFYVNSPEYDKSIKPYPYDPKSAMELLKAAGWERRNGDGPLMKDGTPFAFEFLISSGSKFGEQLATIVQENLKQVGIAVSIRTLEWAVFLQRIEEHNFDACTLAWSLSWESDPYQLWHSSQASDKGSNFVGFRNKEADGIMEKARTEFDAEKRIRLYHRFHAILHEEQPYTFLFSTDALVAISRRFQDVNIYAMGPDPREWWVPKALQKYREP
ncbi:MAG: peptide-binding protein [Syntrophobacteraceae bacterium]|nr:peptide-binding protein [Desulfobacteraceae bacterium]